MKLQELVERLTLLFEVHGNVNVFIGDMVPVAIEDFDVFETFTDDPGERHQYGEKYLLFGDR